MLSATGCAKVNEWTLRQRIRRGLGDDSILIEALSDSSTDVKPIDADFLPQWQIVDVSYNGASHPLRWFLAVTRDGDPRVVVLSGFPERWKQITEGAVVESAGEAEAIAKMWFDTTRSMATLGYRVEAVDDIKWASKPAPEVERAKKQLARSHAISAPRAERKGTGWQLILWTMDNQTLLEHTVTVSSEGHVTDKAVTREEDLPAAIGI